ncbi:unnamed protein product [Gadus morhua 'NCC']
MRLPVARGLLQSVTSSRSGTGLKERQYGQGGETPETLSLPTRTGERGAERERLLLAIRHEAILAGHFLQQGVLPGDGAYWISPNKVSPDPQKSPGRFTPPKHYRKKPPRERQLRQLLQRLSCRWAYLSGVEVTRVRPDLPE